MAGVKGGWVYIMTNTPRGVLYVGVTAALRERIEQHRRGEGSEFCARYGLHRLVYAEAHDEIRSAIEREKRLKRWRRGWKFQLVEAGNPNWDDIRDSLPFD